jgi:hypothetical protein
MEIEVFAYPSIERKSILSQYASEHSIPTPTGTPFYIAPDCRSFEVALFRQTRLSDLCRPEPIHFRFIDATCRSIPGIATP